VLKRAFSIDCENAKIARTTMPPASAVSEVKEVKDPQVKINNSDPVAIKVTAKFGLTAAVALRSHAHCQRVARMSHSMRWMRTWPW
jgi:hypothetical protein